MSIYQTTLGREGLVPTKCRWRYALSQGHKNSFSALLLILLFMVAQLGAVSKTYALLMEPTRHLRNPGFGATIFRRTSPQISNEGALWDTSETLYPLLNGVGITSPYRWSFPSGAKIEFHHLQHEKNIYDWQGAQIPLIGYDELTHFTERQFFYMLSRNRSLSGVKPYIRAATNPDPASWVKRFILWWLDEDGEYADSSKAGVIRWMVRLGDDIHWFDARKGAADYVAETGVPKGLKPENLIKSVTFIPSSVYDNKILMEANPEYVANLMALPRVERLQLLKGNWKVKATAGEIFSRDDFETVDSVPTPDTQARCWDKAATEPSSTNPDPDWTAGVKMQRTGDTFFITDVRRFRKKAGGVQTSIKATTTHDGHDVIVVLFQDPAQAGKFEVAAYRTLLAGFPLRIVRESGKKYLRWRPLAAQAEGGKVKLLRGDWNEPFLSEMENLSEDDSEYAHDDQADGAAGAFGELTGTTWRPVA